MNPPTPENTFLGRCIYDRATPQHEAGIKEITFDRSFAGMFDLVGDSSIPSARDVVAHQFKRTGLELLALIDSDIAFRRADWALLMEQHGDELAVCAEYLKKTQDLSCQVAHFGLGFARIHRSVFEQLDELVDADGAPRLLRYRARIVSPLSNRELMEDLVEYHPVGVTFDGTRRNEDHGFWLLVRLAQIRIRVERRTHLGHTGPYTWWYDATRVTASQTDEGAQ